MSNLLKYTKRVWTAVLASALILTSVPYNVYADEPDNTSEPEIVEVVDDVELTADGADGDSLLSGDAEKSMVTFNGTDCTFADDGHTGITKTEEVWYVNQTGEEGSKTNLSEIKVKLTASDHYTLTGTGASVSATVGGVDAYVSEPDGGVYTIKKATDSSEALDGGVAISATAVPVTHEVTVTDSTDGKATFTVLAGMEPGESGKYTIAEKDGYSFTVKTTEKNKVPKVSRKAGEADYSEMTGELNTESGAYTYSVDAASATTNDEIKIELKDDVKYKLTASGNAVVKYATSKTAAESEWAEIASEGVELFKGDTIYYKVTANDNYRLADSNAVTIGSEAQTADANGIYIFTMGTEAKQISVATVPTATLTFNLTGVKSLKYSVGSAVTTPESLDLTKSPVTLTVDSGKTVYIRSIEAADGYDMQGDASTGYAAVTVKLGDTVKAYSSDYQSWALGTISSAGTVAVEIKKEKSTVTISDSSKLLKSIKVQEKVWDSSAEDWKSVTDNELGSLIAKTFSDGKIELTINKGSVLFLAGAAYADSNAEHAVWNKLVVKDGTKTTYNVTGVPYDISDDKPFQTFAIENGTCTIELGTGTLETSNVKIDEGTTGLNDTTPLTIDNSSKVSVSEKEYLKRVGGLTFTLTPASGKAIKEVTYSYVCNEPEKKDTGSSVIFTDKEVTKTGTLNKLNASEWKYTLPEEDVQKAIAYGSDITISAVTGADTVTVNFTKDSNTENAATVKYQEYAVMGTGDSKTYTAVGSEVEVSGYGAETDIKSYDNIKNGSILAVSVTAASDQLVLSDSVKFNGQVLTAQPTDAADAIKGKYVITPEEAESYDGKNVFTVDTYAAATVNAVTEATGTYKGAENTTLTATSITAGVGSGKATGGAITFTQSYASGIETPNAMYVTLGAPAAKYTTGSGDDAVDTSMAVAEDSENPGTWTIAKSEVEKAIKAGGTITITPAATVNAIKTITAATESATITNISVYKDEAAAKSSTASAINSKDSFAANDTFDIPEGGYVVVSGIDGAADDTDWALYTVTAATVTPYYQAAKDKFYLGAVSADSTIKAEKKDLAATAIKGANEDLLSDDYYTIAASVDSAAVSSNKIKVADSARVYVTAQATSGDTVNNFVVNKFATLYIGNAEDGEPITLSYDSDAKAYYYDIPATTLAEAAFATAATGGALITIGAFAESSGYQTQALTIASTNSASDIEASVISGGAVLDAETDGTYALSYNKNAEVTVAPVAGYEIKAVGYMTAKNHTKLSSISDAALFNNTKYAPYRTAGILNEDGTATVELASVSEPMYIYVTTAPKYSLTLDGVEITDEAKDGGYSTPSDYNVTKTIVLKNGSSVVDLSSATYTVTATTGTEAPVDVKSTVLTVDSSKITFNGSNESVQGKDVTVTIAPAAPESTLDTYKIVFENSKAISTEDIKFTAEGKAIAAYQLGTTAETPVELKDGFDTSKVKLIVTNNSDAAIETASAGFNADCSKVVISTGATAATKALVGNAVKVKIVDANVTSTVIDTLTVNVTASQVTGATFTVAAAGDDNSIKLTFTKGDYNVTSDNLYYLVNVARASGDSDALTYLEAKSNILIPATLTSYTVSLLKNGAGIEDSETDAHKWDVSAQLVQTVPGAEGAYNSGNNIAISTATLTASNVETTSSGIYPTSMKFNKNSAAPKKIVSTMDSAILLGNVTFVTAGNTPATVQKIKKVVVTDKSGAVVADSDNDSDAIYFDGANIYIVPTEIVEDAGAVGTFNVIAYAVEPKGYDVTVKTSVAIAQGVEAMSVTAPARVYRAAGKKLTIKPAVEYLNTAGTAAIKPAVKTVTWTLGTPIPSGVSINAKTGVITVDAAAPSIDYDLTVNVTAEDAAGYIATQVTANANILVTSEAQQATKIMIGDEELEEGATYLSNELYGALTAYDEYMNEVESTFTLKGLDAIKTGKVITGAYVGKVSSKNTIAASVTATAADGSKTKKTISFLIASDSNLNFALYDYSGAELLSGDANLPDKSATNTFGTGKYMYLTISGENGAMIDHSVSFKGAKNVRKYLTRDDAGNLSYGITYVLSPNSDVTEVNINKNAIKLTITNTAIATKTAAKNSTAVAASNKYRTGYNATKNTPVEKDAKGAIFNYMHYDNAATYENAGSPNTVTYTVNVNRAPATGSVLVSTDDPALKKIFDQTNNFSSAASDGDYIVNLTNGQFSVKYTDDADKGNFDITKGNYKFTVTPVNDEGVATAKTVTITVKAAPAPKANVAMNKTSFTNFASSAAVGFSTQTNIAVISTTDGGKVTYTPSAKFGALKGINNKGNISKFATVFNITNANSGTLTCVKSPKNYDVDYTAKPTAGIPGYVELTWTNLDGTTGSKFVKVTVKPASKGEIKPGGM